MACMLVAALGIGAHAKESTPPAKANFHFNGVWAGNWTAEKQVSTRLTSELFAPFGLAFKTRLLDKRPVPPWQDWSAGTSEWGAGFYHQPTGSRILYGKLDYWGLAARTRNVWSHTAPWLESRRSSGADLKTQIAVNTEPALYAYLASPGLISLLRKNRAQKFDVSFNASGTFLTQDRIFYQAGSDIQFNSAKTLHSVKTLHIEGLWYEKPLAEYQQQGWFSEKPSLPARDMRFYALGLLYNQRSFGFGADFAHSEVFAWGEDNYLNGGIRIGNRPWRISIAADTAGRRYMGINAAAAGAGLRIAGKFEWFGPRNMKFLAETKLRSGAAEAPFDRSASKLSYTFPIMRKKFFTPTQAAIELERNGAAPAHIMDSYRAALSLKAGPVRPTFKLIINETRTASPQEPVIPYPVFVEELVSHKIKLSCDVSYLFFITTLQGGAAYQIVDTREPSWSAHASISTRGTWGSITVKITAGEKELPFNYLISWRFKKSFPSLK